MSEIKTYAESIFDELVAIRRDIHAHPETGMREVRTSALIRAELEKWGWTRSSLPCPPQWWDCYMAERDRGSAWHCAPISMRCLSMRKRDCPLPVKPRV